MFSILQLSLKSRLNFFPPNFRFFLLGAERFFLFNYFWQRRFSLQQKILNNIIKKNNRRQTHLFLLFILCVDIIVSKDEIADCQSEYWHWNGDTVEESPGDLPVVHPGDHHLGVQAGVEAGEVESLLSEGI